jgi:hypothetical protein
LESNTNITEMTPKNIVAKFRDEHTLLTAVKRLKDQKVNILDAYGPFATHDLLKKLTRESRLPYMAVLYGIFAIIAIFSLIYYTAVIDYPLMYGGKPYFSFPPMVVLMFLVCILLTTILSTLTFHGRTMIFPGKPTDIMDPSVTDDAFFLVLDQNYNPEEIKGWLREDGAEEVFEKEM